MEGEVKIRTPHEPSPSVSGARATDDLGLAFRPPPNTRYRNSTIRTPGFFSSGVLMEFL